MRLYLVGTGVIARTHVASAMKLDEPIELHAVDTSHAALESFVSEHAPAGVYSSTHEMLASSPAQPDDIVIIATPPAAHFAPALAALESGRNVLCEKPLTFDSAEAEQLLAASEGAGVMLGVCSTRFRELPHTLAVKEVLASGVLGDVYAMTFITKWARSRAGIEYQPTSRWFLDSRVSGGGVLMDWGPYDMSSLFDLLRPTRVEVRDAWIAQPITSADPADAVFDVETDVGAALRFTLRDGTVLPVTYGRASGTHATESAHGELSGTRGAVRWTPFDSSRPVYLRTEVDGELQEREVDPGPRSEITFWDRPLAAFVDALRGRPSVATLGREAVAEYLVLRAMYRTARTGEPQTVEVGAVEVGA